MNATLHTTRVVVFILAVLLVSPAAAQEKEPIIGEVHVRTMAPITFAYVPTETTFDRLGEAIGEVMPLIEKAATDGKIRVTSPFVLAYPEGSAHLNGNKPFKVQVGLRIEEGSEGAAAAADAGDVKVRTTQPFKCATIMYMGPIARIGDCYQKLFPAIEKMGLSPGGEEREFTLYFEGLESANNIVLIQVGVKDKEKGAAEARPATAAPAGVPPLPPELKLLEPLVGSWDTTFTTRRLRPAPGEVKSTGVVEMKWATGGRFMQVDVKSSDGAGALAVMTYDPARGQFHRWYFHSTNGFSESWGQWDESSQTFTWKAEHPGGAMTTLRDKRMSDDRRAWNAVYKDPEGNVAAEVEGVSVRRK
jgi:effector-binding domain-containing protein